jgi:MFS family permease
MKLWKRNLIVCWFGVFVTNIGTSQIAPVLPLFIRHLGVHNTEMIEQFSGFAFGVNYMILAIFSPIWGHFADKVGRKPMLLRSSFGMAIVIFSMGFAQNVYQLIGLRMLQGVIAGYTTACTTLIATQTEKEHAGWALGSLATASIGGSLLGPMIGGFIEENLGMQNVFFITGTLMLIAFITTLLFVRESFNKEEKVILSAKQVWRRVPDTSLLGILFLTSFIITLALYSIEPIITVYVTHLSSDSKHVALISGMAFSASGLASIIAAPRLGRLSDRIGPQKVMLGALLIAGIVFIPQAFVKSSWQLMGLRFVLGLATAGLTPSVNILIKRISPDELTGRIFGFSMSAQYIGVFLGSILGGQVSAFLGIRYVFFITSVLLSMNAILVYFSVYKKLSKVSI